MNSSKFLRLSINDIIKSAIVACISAFLCALYPVVSSGNLPDFTQLKIMVITALSSGIGYLIKNLFTNSNGEILKSEKKE